MRDLGTSRGRFRNVRGSAYNRPIRRVLGDVALQCPEVRHDASSQRLQFVATFQNGHDTSPRMASRNAPELIGDPGIVGFGEIKHRHLVVPVPVEAG